jgi:hypothetical protein
MVLELSSSIARNVRYGALLVLLLTWPAAAPSAASADTLRITDAPSVSGVMQAGAELTSSPGSWTPADGVPSYQWLRCDGIGEECVAIEGAEALTYQITAADVGHTLAVRLTVAWGTSTRSRKSERTDVVEDPIQAAPPVNSTPPTIAGDARAGSELTADSGSWVSTLSTSFAYAWERCDDAGGGCEAIPQATAATHIVTDTDVGHTLRVAVTATSSAGAATATSAATAVVIAAPPPADPAPPQGTDLPVISGAAVVGQTLVANAGGWSGEGPYAFAYQWLRCDAFGAACSALVGAGSAAYVVSPDQVGSRLRVRVTATTPAGSAAAESEPTAVVAPAEAPQEASAGVVGAPATGSIATETALASPAVTALTSPAVTALTSPARPALVPPVLMRPFPRVRVAGRFSATRTWIKRAVISAPRDAQIAVRCTATTCPSGERTLGARPRRVRYLERAYAPGSVIEIRVTRSGTIGKYVRITIHAARAPSRTDSCLLPGSRKPVPCPAV